MALMAVAAIAMTSCHSSMTDIMTSVVNSGQGDGTYAAEKFVDTYVQAIAEEQGGSAVSNTIVLKAQSDNSKAKAGAVKGADKAKAAILAQKSYEITDWVTKETYTVQVTEGTESDNNASITVTVGENQVVMHYYKVSK